MRILFLIDSLAASGAERSLAQLVPHLVKRGLVVDVGYLWERDGLHGELRSAGAAVFSLAGPGGRAGRLWRSIRLIRRRRPDLVHTALFDANVVGRVAARAAGVPVVSTWTGLSYGAEHRGAPHLKAWKVDASQVVDVASARLVARFHAVADHVADAMSARLRVRPERVEVIPRGRDLRWLGAPGPERRAAVRGTLGLGDERVVLAVARHDWKKGLDTLLESFAGVRARYPDARLLIAGTEAHDTAALRRQALSLSLDGSLEFLGPRSDVPDLICAADVFVLPSRSEGFPGVLLEAMALESPIVASDIPAVRDLTGGESVALLAPPGDVNGLMAGISATFERPAEAAGRARAGRARFMERYQIEGVADRMIEFYKRALRTSRRKQS